MRPLHEQVKMVADSLAHNKCPWTKDEILHSAVPEEIWQTEEKRQDYKEFFLKNLKIVYDGHSEMTNRKTKEAHPGLFARCVEYVNHFKKLEITIDVRTSYMNAVHFQAHYINAT